MARPSSGPAGVRDAKAALRRRMQAVSPATPAESRAVTARLGRLSTWQRAESACLFLPMAGELDVTGLVALHPAVAWLVTRTPPHGALTVHSVDAPRERHPWGFEQPVADAARVAPDSVDVFVVPGVAFDDGGNRLGHGAGYYDRLLSAAHRRATFVAATLRRRLVTAVPVEDHDVSMHAVVTEAATLHVGGLGSPPPLA